MWKPNLNRHFTISAFLILWNGLFHSLTLSILVYWSHSSLRVPELGRMSTLNQFWSENEFLFATISTCTMAFLLKDQFTSILLQLRTGFKKFGVNFLKGSLFSILLISGLILSKHYEFLGFSAQLSLNFLTSYAWLLRSFLILMFVLSTESVVRIVLRAAGAPLISEIFTQLAIYWIWFNPSLQDLTSLALIFLLFRGFWSSSGFIAGLLIIAHAVFGLPLFENEFVGVFQLKALASDQSFLQNSYVLASLFVLVSVFRGSRLFMLKSKRKENQTS